jgi:hypothetical protein
MKNKLIVVFCYSRAAELDKCLTSLRNARGLNAWKIIVLQQHGHAKVDKIVAKHRSIINTSIIVKPGYQSVLGNINNNRILGMRIAFNEFNADCVLGIEEDNLISTDALEFIDFILCNYNNKRFFMGINLGSLEYGKHIESGGFSLLRSGLHGSAGVLTRKTWLALEKRGYLDFDFEDLKNPWDVMIEFYLKRGFMVTSNLSKNLDIGYGGAFSPKDSNDHLFVSNRRSWNQSNRFRNFRYIHSQIPHNMKKDIIAFNNKHNILYVARSHKIITKVTQLVGVKKFISEFLIKHAK